MAETTLVVAVNKRDGKPQLAKEFKVGIPSLDPEGGFWRNFKNTLEKHKFPLKENHFIKMTEEEFEDAKQKWELKHEKISEKLINERNIDQQKEYFNEKPSNYKYEEGKVDWKSLEDAFGISKEELRKSGALDELLLGKKTSDLFQTKTEIKDEMVPSSGRLYLKEVNGKIYVNCIQKLESVQVDKPFFGYVFTKEDKENLLETGNLGHAVELQYGQNIKTAFVSIDKGTNQLTAFPTSAVKIPEKIMGVEINSQQKAQLEKGESILIDGISKAGKEWKGTVQFNAYEMKVDWVKNKISQHENKKENNPILKIFGVETTSMQQEDLKQGKEIEMTNLMINTFKKGEDGKFILDENDQKIKDGKAPKNGRVYLDEENNPKIKFNTEISGVSLSHEAQQAFNRGEEIHIQGMISKAGKSFDAYVKAGEDGKINYDFNKIHIKKEMDFLLDEQKQKVKLSENSIQKLYEGKTIIVTIKDDMGKDANIYLKVSSSDKGKEFLKSSRENPEKAIKKGIAKIIKPTSESKIQIAHNNKGLKTQENKGEEGVLSKGETKLKKITPKKTKEKGQLTL